MPDWGVGVLGEGEHQHTKVKQTPLWKAATKLVSSSGMTDLHTHKIVYKHDDELMLNVLRCQLTY